MEFLPLSRRRSSARNVPSGEEEERNGCFRRLRKKEIVRKERKTQQVNVYLRSTKENAYYSCTVHNVVTVPNAMRFHVLEAILDRPGTFCLDLMCSVFLTRELVSIL